MDRETRKGKGMPALFVGPMCHVQTAENRFGPEVLEDIKTFVYKTPAASAMDDMDDDDDEDEDDDDDEDDDEIDMDMFGDDMAPDVHMEDDIQGGMADQPSDPSSPDHQGFPRMARTRSNLTALSQRFNLYFTAYQDKIYVYQPRRAPHILPAPVMILHPKRTKAGKMTPSTMDRTFAHQINHLIIGNFGDLEILFFAYDDGDVAAYYTHTLARYILADSEQRLGAASGGGAGGASLSRPAVPKEFFHDNVGLTAWGLAVHEKSRLLAVSSNRHEVTVFAFAMTRYGAAVRAAVRTAADEGEAPDVFERSPKTWSGQTALELERHFQSRTRTWRIILPLGMNGHNVPMIAFCDDDEGYADKVVAVDVNGNTWFLDIWKIGNLPVLYPPTPSRVGSNHPRYIGWGVLVLPDSSFKETRTVFESLGVPSDEVLSASTLARAATTANRAPVKDSWLDTTCSLFYVQDLAPDPDNFLRNRSSNLYFRAHADRLRNDDRLRADADRPRYAMSSLPRLGPPPDDVVDFPQHDAFDGSDDDDDSDMSDNSGLTEAAANIPALPAVDDPLRKRWAGLAINENSNAPAGAQLDDISEDVQLGRFIIPSFGQTPPPIKSAGQLVTFANHAIMREGKSRPVPFLEMGAFPPHLAKKLSILRTTATDIELQPLDPTATGIVCKCVLTHYNHLTRRTEPWDLHKNISERVSMLLHVPELNLVVAGSLNGRVALLTLTKTAKRIGDTAVRRGFRVDAVLPRRAEEDKKVRPWCTLHGVAISPVPDARARGLDLRASGGGGGRFGVGQGLGQQRPPPSMYRLMLHYLDHTVLMYDVAREEPDTGDLLIF